MIAETLMLLAAFIIAIVGVYKYVSAENNEYKALVDKVAGYEAEVATANKNYKEMQTKYLTVKVQLETLKKAVEQANQEVEQAQDHMSKLRDSQIQLRDRSYPRKIDLDLSFPRVETPIPIQVIKPTRKKAVRKKKKNVRKKKTKTQSATYQPEPNEIIVPALQETKQAMQEFEA